MSPIVTNVQSAPVAGLWQRMAALQRRGVDLGAGEMLARMEELGIPRDQRAVVHAVTTWANAGVLAEEGFALWALRQRQDADGGFRRVPGAQLEETCPTVRYVQLALGAGETIDTDVRMRRAVDWILAQIRSNGEIPDAVDAVDGESGTMARAISALTATVGADSALVRRAREALESRAETAGVGVAWRTQPAAATPVTGATALAICALLPSGGSRELVTRAARWLVAVQNSDGGWPEVPVADRSTPSAASNSFTVVRALRAVASEGLAVDEISQALDAARHWCRAELSRSVARSTHDAAFLLRLAVSTDLDEQKKCRELVGHFQSFVSREWTPSCDVYVDIELVALALQEWRLAGARRGEAPRMALPHVPPPFLRREPRVYDVLYRMSSNSRWIPLVDHLARAGVAEALLGAAIGGITMLAVLDERILGPLAHPAGGRDNVARLAMIAMLIAWLAVRLLLSQRRRSTIVTLLSNLAVSALLWSWTLDAYAPDSWVGAALALAAQLMVVDVVSYTADQSGVVRRLLPDG